MIRRSVILFWVIILSPALCVAGGPTIPGFYGNVTPALPPVAPNALPVPQTIIQGINSISTPGTGQMVVYQNQPQAIINWQTFNIGQNASVYFNQQGNSNWAALNRIWDSNPSQIFGCLKADGQVYLINQNGILFGPGSQVNVHTLIASSLNINVDSWINNGTLAFNTNQGTINGQPDPFYNPGQTPGVVSNHGIIQTDNLGSVFLLGFQVENSGTISAPMGQIGLAAGTDVELALPVAGSTILTYPGGETRTTYVIKMNNSPQGATAWNLQGGLLAADTGVVGMYGNIVNQDGLIRSVTAVQRGGHVELFASQEITTGPNSLISLPVSNSPEQVNVSFPTAQSDVTFSGLDPNNPGQPRVYVGLIDHQGAIVAPSGLVTMNAVNRVYLASGSTINVSGLWVDRPAEDSLLQVQMNSVNLRDDFVQKGGVLQGQNIQFNALAGSAIGDVSGAFTTEGLSAAERHTMGGTVIINLAGDPNSVNRTATGDIVMMQGAVIDFSGGGFRYEAGSLDTTMLVSGNKVYDISTANPNIVYDKILNLQTVTYPRYGITETYEGIYYGGANPVKNYSPEYVVGDNAGTLSLQARQVVLDGTILGQVTNGLQQTMAANPVNETGNQSMSGYQEAVGGQLMIGDTQVTNVNADLVNFLVQSITISPQVAPLPSGFKPTDPLPYSTTVLPASTLSNAGLSSISLAANTTITVQTGAQVTLNPGGTFSARARRIENYGGITALGGNINLSIETNLTTNPVILGGANPNYVPLDERIYLASGSSLIASGEKIDNTTASTSIQGLTPSGYIAGGSIQILDKTVTGQGVAIMPGALIDVSGGYQIDASGKVSGGDAGSLTLQGYSLAVNGDLRGLSLVGNNGGTISMTACNVSIVGTPLSLPAGFNAESPWPQNLKGQLILGANQLAATGFTNITLNSVNDIVFGSGVSLGPSTAKLANPGDQVLAAAPVDSGIIRVTMDQIGTSSFSLNAGVIPSNLTMGGIPSALPMNSQNLLARLVMPAGTALQTGPGGSIGMSAPYIDIAGSMSAPSGSISISAKNNLAVQSGAEIRADGYNSLGTTPPVQGMPVEATPMPGGTVTLTAGIDLNLSQGSLVSVSGSSPVRQTVVGDGGSISFITEASQPGSISLSTQGTIELKGELMGQAMIGGLPGGTLSVATGGSTLSLSAGDLLRFQNGGFDAVSLTSPGQLTFSGSGQIDFGRSLTLNSPVITGSGSGQLTLSAPWVQVTNSAVPASSSPASGSASLNLVGTWLDVSGNVLFSGFKNLNLEAAQDLRLSDIGYGSLWSGLLSTAGDLTVKASRVYPTTLSQFTISANGKITILPGDSPNDGPIFSAGGSLTIQAGQGIEQDGFLAAPMGTISLQATGANARVYLADGSVTTTQGNAQVNYGYIQTGTGASDLGTNIWAIDNKGSNAATVPYLAVQNAPGKSISISGAEVIVNQGATLDISGGGSVFAYQFFPSPSGSVNPLTKPNTYVILPDNSVVFPGNAVYLAGTNGVPAGTYSLLPAQFAFLPGAMIVTDLGINLSTTKQTLTADGYPIVAGYATTMGTGIRAQQFTGYEVRPAAGVLAEGEFSIQTQTAGDAGSVTLSGKTTILDGMIQAQPLSGFSGGSIALSGTYVTVQPSAISLPAGFGFTTPVPTDLVGTLNIAAPSLSGKGFQTIGLGFSNLDDPADSIQASQVTLKAGVVLQAENIILAANNLITLEPGAQVLALAAPGDTGQASLISPTGKAVIGPNAVVHASDAISLQTAALDLQGTLLADRSALNLQGSIITIIPDGVPQPSGSGTFLTASQWNSFSNTFENIALSSASDLVFDGTFNLSVKNSLTIDAGRIMDSVTGSTVALQAQTITLQNTTGAPTPAPSGIRTAQITLTAPEIQVGEGNILFDTFSSINLNAQNDLTFKGIGTLQTGGGDLNISTARVTTSYYLEPAAPANSPNAALPPIYTAANFTIDAGSTGTVTIQASGGTATAGSTPGGTLAIDAQTIEVSTLVEIPSGQLILTASDNIFLKSGAQLWAKGTDYAPGGSVSLMSTGGGAITLDAGAAIDVSAGNQGDAGSISFYAPSGGVQLAGALLGQAAPGGQGGSLSLVTSTINDFGSLNQKLAAGGFNESISIEASLGDIVIPMGQTVSARSLKITADSGSIDLLGTIDVSQNNGGGTAELYATQNLTMTGSILARGTGTDAPGGQVVLSVAGNGTLFLSGGLIDVSGSGTGIGGTVVFCDPPPPPPQPYPTNMSLSGTIKGASSVTAEVEQVYVNQYPVIDLTAINQIYTDISNYMNTYGSSLKTLLLSHLMDGNGNALNPAIFHLQPGVVIEETGNLTLSSDWDLTSWRFGGEPGVLTLRATGNLNINANLIDNPTDDMYAVRSDSVQPSWSINLVAGAQMGSPDLLAVNPAGVQGVAPGNLTLAPQILVYTESGSIRFASSGDTVINQGIPHDFMVSYEMNYSLATYSGLIQGNVGGNLTINPGGVIQSATGNIDIQTGGDLNLVKGYAGYPSVLYLGTIRTTGEYAEGASNYYGPYDAEAYSTYAGGGSIRLQVGGSVNGGLSNNWLVTDYDANGVYTVMPDYSTSMITPSTEGIAAMGGGSVYVRTGGNFNCQTGTFGQGDLQIFAGGNLQGRFLVKQGTGELSAMGNFGIPTHEISGGILQNAAQLIEAFDANISVVAQGNVELGTVLNPTLAATALGYTWENQYTPASSVSLTAVTGDVNLYGSVDVNQYGSFYQQYYDRNLFLPPTVDISAGRDINVNIGIQSYVLLPSPTGNLTMKAGNDIIFQPGSKIMVSDADPAQVYGASVSSVPDLGTHASVPVHTGDSVPITISAGGDIVNANFTFPKMAEIWAGGNIVDLTYSGQNINASDVTSIVAAGNILYGYTSNVSNEMVELGGPGYLLVQAGGKIDLGNTMGITTVGNFINPALGPEGSSIIAVAGLSRELNPEEVSGFFDSIRSAGSEYSQLQASGNQAGAQQCIQNARANIIAPFLGSSNGAGDISMTYSQISTTGGGQIFVVATGSLDVGLTALNSSQSNSSQSNSTGIFTSTGGGINVFANGDVNVNESRIMTFQGGDITVWSDHGNINAGRGSKTVINAGTPQYSCNKTTGVCSLTFTPPAVGSGIRALTYAPAENVAPPPAGDIYLFAPQGVIDAGEAGISGGKVILGAVAVLNVSNISFSAGSVGVPTQTESVNLGALTGTTSLIPKSTVMDEAGGIGAMSRSAVEATQPIEEIVMKWLEVKVIDFDMSYGVVGEEEKKEQEKK